MTKLVGVRQNVLISVRVVASRQTRRQVVKR